MLIAIYGQKSTQIPVHVIISILYMNSCKHTMSIITVTVILFLTMYSAGWYIIKERHTTRNSRTLQKRVL